MALVGTLKGARRTPSHLRSVNHLGKLLGIGVTRDMNVGHPLKSLNRSPLSLSNSEIKRVGLSLSTKCTVNIDALTWFETLDLDDTFFSWFKVVELHVWMVSLRLLQDPSSEMNEVFFSIQNSLIEAIWNEAHNRIGSVGVKGRKRNNYLSGLSNQLRIAFLLYDDGVLGSDIRLANALWEGFFNKRDDISVEQLSRMVEYVRQNLLMLEKLESSNIAIKQNFSWTSIKNISS
uniref:Ubiquinol-cytochrome c reductase complex chaperone CBP3 homolog n=1 Tax=Lepeophtheirus salmonis TaxID=72036 RepID=C1BVH2_LEPSM|nr:Ubiquinol-cytochrome c reductase complex chaperone CBP3 homolog [Lepeophtheirus salmonis]